MLTAGSVTVKQKKFAGRILRAGIRQPLGVDEEAGRLAVGKAHGSGISES
jgi:hypothetical protein